MLPAPRALLCLLLFACGVAGADQEDPLFDKLDADQDDFISRAEAVKDARIAKRFEQLDINKDDRLDKAEFEASLVPERTPDPAPAP